MSKIRRRAIVAGAGLVATMIGATSGAGAVSPVTYRSCISQVSGNGCVAAAATSLGDLEQVVVSPDAKSVYTAATDPGVVTLFGRNPRGGFTDLGCIAEDSGTGCPAPYEPALEGADAIAVSPDGKNVYVSAGDSDAVVSFARSSTGALTYLGCLANTNANGCTPLTHQSLEDVGGLAISPDGANVYATATDGGISVFGRSTSGALTDEGCLAQSGSGDGCTATTTAVDEPLGITVSPDGKNVYVSAYGSGEGALTTFSRAAGGALTQEQCISEASIPGCVTALQDSLYQAKAPAVSSDGKSVYLAAPGRSAITTFNRAADGSLTDSGCIAPAEDHGCMTPTGFVLDTAQSITLSPDGTEAFITHNNGMSEFSRSSTGALSYLSCYSYLATDGCAATAQSQQLHYSVSAAVTPDGGTVYVGSDGSVSELFTTLPAPNTTITKATKTRHTVTLHFASTEPLSTFLCKVDKHPSVACTSPHKFSKLKAGTHHFRVAAINAQLTGDASAATRTVKLKPKHKKHHKKHKKHKKSKKHHNT